jgi:hypothetical protein
LQASSRDTKKLAEKERKLLEKSVREKEIALRDDDNVFDVSYENQGDASTEVVSATDIKVSLPPSTLLPLPTVENTFCLDRGNFRYFSPFH